MPTASEISVIDTATLEKIKLIAEELRVRGKELAGLIAVDLALTTEDAESSEDAERQQIDFRACRDRAGESDSDQPLPDCIDVVEKLQRIAYGAVREVIAYRYHLATGKYAAFDTVEYYMPDCDDVAEFDFDAVSKRIADSPECTAMLCHYYETILGAKASEEELTVWREQIASGISSFGTVEISLQKRANQIRREQEIGGSDSGRDVCFEPQINTDLRR